MQVTPLRDGRFYQPFFKYPQINKSSVATFDLDTKQLNFLNNFNSTIFKGKDLNYLNQIVTLTFGYDQIVLIYENYNNKQLLGGIKHFRNEDEIVNFNLPKEFKKKEDINFFYFSSDYDRQVYFLQLKSTKQVFVKGTNTLSILGIWNEKKNIEKKNEINENVSEEENEEESGEENFVFEDWTVITDKRLQNIKDIKTNTYTTLFFMEDNKIYSCGRDTNGKLCELIITPENQTSQLTTDNDMNNKTNREIDYNNNELQIIKADLLIDGTILLTKSGEIYSTSTTDSFQVHTTFVKDNSKKFKLIGSKNNNIVTQFVIDFKVLDMFVVDNGLLVVRKDDLKLFILNSGGVINVELYLYEVKNVFFSYTEFYFETKKNELVFISKGKKTVVCDCNASVEYSKLNFPMVRSILNFNSEIYIFFEEEDLIKRNFYYPLNECEGYKDISIFVNNLW